MTGSPIHQNIESLLIVCPSWIGDCVMATPVYRAAREYLPHARITALVRDGLDDVLAGSPWFDELIVGSMKGFAGPMRMAQQIRHLKPQAALLLPNSFRSALTMLLAGIPKRIGYLRDGRSWLLTHRLEPQNKTMPIPAVDYYQRLGQFAFDLEIIDPQLELFVTDTQCEDASGLLSKLSQPFVVLNPGANKAAKRWPADRFAAVADHLHQKYGIDAAVSGSPGERDLTRQVCEAAETNVVDLAAGGISLGALKAVLQKAVILITNDTGPRHLAAALGRPVVSLFGPTDHRWTTLVGSKERILLAEPFLPDELKADDHPEVCRVDRIGVDDVVEAARKMLESAGTITRDDRRE